MFVSDNVFLIKRRGFAGWSPPPFPSFPPSFAVTDRSSLILGVIYAFKPFSVQLGSHLLTHFILKILGFCRLRSVSYYIFLVLFYPSDFVLFNDRHKCSFKRNETPNRSKKIIIIKTHTGQGCKNEKSPPPHTTSPVDSASTVKKCPPDYDPSARNRLGLQRRRRAGTL